MSLSIILKNRVPVHQLNVSLFVCEWAHEWKERRWGGGIQFTAAFHNLNRNCEYVPPPLATCVPCLMPPRPFSSSNFSANYYILCLATKILSYECITFECIYSFTIIYEEFNCCCATKFFREHKFNQWMQRCVINW